MEDQIRLFVSSLDPPVDLNAPRVVIRLRESQLRVWNAKFRRPSPDVPVNSHIPDSIPAVIRLRVIGKCSVLYRADGIDDEVLCRSSVMGGIDSNSHLIRLGVLIATREPSNNRVGVGIVEFYRDIECVVIISDPCFGPLGYWLSFIRLTLDKPCLTGALPRTLCELSVDLD